MSVKILYLASFRKEPMCRVSSMGWKMGITEGGLRRVSQLQHPVCRGSRLRIPYSTRFVAGDTLEPLVVAALIKADHVVLTSFVPEAVALSGTGVV